jgi:hypothetical protein
VYRVVFAVGQERGVPLGVGGLFFVDAWVLVLQDRLVLLCEIGDEGLVVIGVVDVEGVKEEYGTEGNRIKAEVEAWETEIE